jgi:dienelactone hydrolase
MVRAEKANERKHDFMKTFLVAVLMLVLCAADTVGTDAMGAPSRISLLADPARSTAGPLALDVETADGLTLHDAARKKELPYKVYFPRNGGPFPVILFSHGFGGSKDAFGPVGKHWASHGYVVIHPGHADGMVRRNDTAVAPRVRPLLGGQMGGFLGGMNDPQKTRDRVTDLVLLLDSLDELQKAVPGLKGKIDGSRIGAAGHSLGAYTAMLIGGVTVDLGSAKDVRFLDKRVKCILPISAQGTGQQGLTDKSWNGLKLPMMTITGTRDRGAGGQGLDWKKEPYKYSPPGNKYLVVIDGANHVSFGGGLGPRGEAITDAVKLSSTHFFDAYLKGSETSKKYLQSDLLTRDTEGKCVLEKK